jgi:hypothetical protein
MYIGSAMPFYLRASYSKELESGGNVAYRRRKDGFGRWKALEAVYRLTVYRQRPLSDPLFQAMEGMLILGGIKR